MQKSQTRLPYDYVKDPMSTYLAWLISEKNISMQREFLSYSVQALEFGSEFRHLRILPAKFSYFSGDCRVSKGLMAKNAALLMKKSIFLKKKIISKSILMEFIRAFFQISKMSTEQLNINSLFYNKIHPYLFYQTSQYKIVVFKCLLIIELCVSLVTLNLRKFVEGN